MTTENPSRVRVALDNRRILFMIRWLLYLFYVVIGFLILRKLAPVFTPIIVAMGIAYLLDPLVDRLEQSMSRAAAVALLLAGFLGIVGGLVAILAPLIVHESAEFVRDAPKLYGKAVVWLNGTFNADLDPSWQEQFSSDKFQDALSTFLGPAIQLVKAAIAGVFSLLGFLAHLLLIPVFAFYFLVDWDNIVRRIRTSIPPRYREQVHGVAGEMDSVVSGWIRGQFTVTSILAVLYALSFKAIDLVWPMQMAISIGLLVGALTVVPFLGTIVGALVTAIIVLVDYQGVGQLVALGGVFLVLHVLEAAVLTPKIVGHRVGLSEVSALFAVVAGGKLLGLTGVFLAVPLAAGVAVLIRRAVTYYEDSAFYGADADDEDDEEEESTHVFAAKEAFSAPEHAAAPQPEEAKTPGSDDTVVSDVTPETPTDVDSIIDDTSES